MKYMNDKGLTLIEVVASIVIIAIVLFSFSSIFIQSKKASNASESVVDATYIAQAAKEDIYGSVTNSSSFDNIAQQLIASGKYTVLSNLSNEVKVQPNDNPAVVIQILPFKEGETIVPKLVRVITSVQQEKGSPVTIEALWRLR